MKLNGRTAIITGASQGLGAAIARRFAAEGARLALCARHEAELFAKRDELLLAYPAARIVAQSADVSCTDDVDALFAAAERAFGRIDVLVNNAGVYGPMGGIDTVDWGEWVKALAINLSGNVYCARKAVQLFKPQGYGKIINLSGGGATNPLPGISAYAASKAALVRFVETLALEVRAFGIDVNAVAPGALATRLTEELIAAGPEKVGDALYVRMQAVQKDGGTPLELGAELCVYLASAESDGLTGRLISAPWDPWPFSAEALADVSASDIYTLRRIVPKERGKYWGDR